MISAQTTLRLPVAGSVIIPSQAEVHLGHLAGLGVGHPHRCGRCAGPQLRFLMNRRNDVYDTVHPRASSNSCTRVTFNRSPVSHW